MFPRAIPLQWVDCIRVTHPCAGRQLLRKVLLPLDLHVLGLPLAFILSQDQTLRCIYSLGQSRKINQDYSIPTLDFKL